jgi:hypothetical protein
MICPRSSATYLVVIRRKAGRGPLRKRKRLSYRPDMDSEEIIGLLVFGVFAGAAIFVFAAFVF